MDMPGAIRAVTERRHLSSQDMHDVMRLIMTGAATSAQIGGFLIGLRMKGETIDEIAAAAQVMRELAAGVKADGEHVVDIVGTGGDSLSTFNISTTCCFIVAAAGGTVAKHGNRSVSSKSGSADVLEAAGVNLEITPEQVARCIKEVGVGFMFAPKHHSAMKHAIGPRREMGVRTIFNILGPLTNPAAAPNQLLGVYADQWLEPLANVLKKLGSRHVMVVHSDDGMDEISLSAATHIAELRNGVVRRYRITPEEFGFERVDVSKLTVDSAAGSLRFMQDVLRGKHGPAHDIVALNAGAALYVAGLATDLATGVDKAKSILDSAAGIKKLEQLVALTQSFK